MPELVAIGTVGAVVVFILVNINLLVVHRSFHSEKFLTLNHNLSLVGKYWSQEQGRLIVLGEKTTEESLKRDHQKSTRSAFVFGTFMIFLSWLGLLFFTVYVLSVHKLAKSRFELRLFKSDLCKLKYQDMKSVETILATLETFQ